MSDEIRSAFIKYLDTYFVQRDLESTLALLSPQITGFGTGKQEGFMGFDQCKELYKRDISEAPHQITYDITTLKIDRPLNTLGIVSCVFNIRTTLLKQDVKLNHLRLSMVFVQTAGKWLAEHMHVSFPTQAHGEEESYPIKELEEQNKVLQRLVEEKTEKLNEAIREISQLATTDKLTGLFNRLKIEECFASELLRSQRYHNQFSVILLDLDSFKLINDEHGHLIGDQFLVEFAELIKYSTRRTEILGRWGGDEFLIICPENSLESALHNAEKMCRAVEAHSFDLVGRTTASFGVSAFLPEDSRESLMARVDAALYDAKKKGKNRVSAR